MPEMNSSVSGTEVGFPLPNLPLFLGDTMNLAGLPNPGAGC